MGKQYLQTQDIFNKVFQNAENRLKASIGYYSTQDYLNAVYDSSKDALRISIEGGLLPAVESVNALPESSNVNDICPVCSNGTIQFYQWNGTEWIPQGGTGSGGGGTNLSTEEQLALSWLAANIDRIKELASYEYIVQSEELVLNKDTSVPVAMTIQGEYQDIDDDGDKDGDSATHYRIDIKGYVLGIETFANNEAATTDRYYTKMVYEPTSGSLGTSHIYLEKEEYEWFAGLSDGKNVLKVFYVLNVFPGVVSVKEEAIAFPEANAAPVVIDIQGNIQDIDDDGNKDGDEATHYRIDIQGYVLDIEGYNSDVDIQKQRFLTKMAYDSTTNVTSIYFTAEEYNLISSFGDNKNIVSIYYLAQQ